ncbi:hypothetical protein ACRARG_12950 [Pseudooceanicola sp. C21-150M6]|uniref:hypothetical protein n=1 Tax=Pseudooceanicola sp. C21-150M6 TaxID=3434355 RepID=UPI003D7FCF65
MSGPIETTMIFRNAALPLFLLAALPAQAEVIETDLIKVFEGKWVQSKDPSQNGILMYLTEQRSAVGEYFSIRCDGSDRSVRIAFPRRRPTDAIGMTLDGTQYRVPAKFVGKTPDPQFVKGNLFGYALNFPDAETQARFLDRVGSGTMLTVEGQTLPIDLAGAGDAVAEQADYCE